jgi:hypothetical protein
MLEPVNESTNSWVTDVPLSSKAYPVGDGMNTMSSQQVIDQIAATLAERRQQARARRGAYLALARAILSDGPTEHTLYALEPNSISPAAAA